MSEKLKQILVSAGVAFLVAKVATSSEENENKNLAISVPRQIQYITSDFRKVEQFERIDYWTVNNFAIPENFIVSEIIAEIYDEGFNNISSSTCVWAVQNPYQRYAIGLLSDNPGIFNIRLVAKVIEI